MAYSQCDESNWESYYPDMEGCNLSWANLSWAWLSGANLDGANLCNLAGSADGECEQPEGIIDENGDGYDDVSYDAGAESGDANHDGQLDVLDIILYANIIVNP